MKKGLALALTVLGGIGLVYGVVTIFNGNLMEENAWIGAVLGVVFFTSGIGLMKSTGTQKGNG